MLRILMLFAMLAPALTAEEHWVYLSSDGFQVFSDAGVRAGRTALVRLEEFRYALGKIIGKTDLKIDPPAQVYVFKTAKEAAQYNAAEPIQKGREHVSILLTGDSLPEDFERRLAKLLIEANTDRMPADLERGLIALFSTLDVTGIKITVGRPVPPPERSTDWARMHLLTVDPQYYGKLPVLFFNLQKGAEDDPAYRNAFDKSKSDIDTEVERYKAAGNFTTTSLSSRAMSEHDFPDKTVESDLMRDKLAGVLRDQKLLADYQALLAQARLQKADTKALEKAIELEPKQAEPRFLLAEREPDPKKRVELLRAAIALDRRNPSYWQALAESYAATHNFAETAKAWRAAEQASATPEEREKMRRAWLDVERQRLDYEDAEKKRAADEEARDLRRLKDAEIAHLRGLEARVNKGSAGAADKPVPWSAINSSGVKLTGALTKVDCLGKQAVLIIQSGDAKLTRVVIRDASQIVIPGAKQEHLGCGPQKRWRVTVEYAPKNDAKLTTIGDVTSIEFSE